MSSACSKSGEEGKAVSNILKNEITVNLNPNGNAPLAATLNFSTKKKAGIGYRLLNASGINVAFNGFKKNHDVTILGLLPNMENEIELKLTQENGNFQIVNLTITTEKLPGYLPEIEVVKNSLATSFYLLEFSYAKDGEYLFTPFIIDNEGKIRWYTTFTEIYFSNFIPLANGNFLTARGSKIMEMDLLGSHIQEWNISPHARHHDMLELPNGNFLICTYLSGLSTNNDQLIELDRRSSDIVKAWDFREMFDFNRKVLSNSPADWLHTNSVWYNQQDNSITISGRHQGVFNFTYEGKMNWIVAPHLNWGKAGINQNGADLNDFLLKAVDENEIAFEENVQKGFVSTNKFDWPFGQHAAMISKRGELLCFDNGWYRNYQFENPYSKVVKYKIDTVNRTIQQVWQHGKEEGSSFFASILGDVDELEDGLLILSGINQKDENRGILKMINPNNNSIDLEVNFNYTNLYGTGEFIWGEFDNIYRVEQVSFY